MPGKVKPEVIAERSERLRGLGRRMDLEFQAAFAARELLALVLRQRAADGRLVALTGNYLEVLLDAGDDLINQLVRVRPERRLPDGRWQGVVV
jgi:tRNA A37 methylthiotransferase MiaB